MTHTGGAAPGCGSAAVPRRRFMRWLAAASAAVPVFAPLRRVLWAREPREAGADVLSAEDEALLDAIAQVALPSELGTDARSEVARSFAAWVRGYREGAEMAHGYGGALVRIPGMPQGTYQPPSGRDGGLRVTPPSPARAYPAQLAALQAAARARHGQPFTALAAAPRRAIVEAAVEEAQVRRLPALPDGGHVATDLLAFWANSEAANDLCYRARIGRDTCRGLPGSGERPARLGGH